MKTGITWSLCACLLGATIGQGHAHIGDRVYTMWEIPSSELPDLHDNTLEDWEATVPGASLDHNDFINGMNGGAADPGDLAVRIFLAWHHASQQVYVAVEFVDDQLVSEADYVSFRIDGDHSGGHYCYCYAQDVEDSGLTEGEIKVHNQSQAQSYTVSAFAPHGSPERIHLTHRGAASGWVTQPPWADMGGFRVGEAPTYSVVEVVLTPWDELHWSGPDASRPSRLEPGRIVGISMDMLDMDVQGEGGDMSWYALFPSESKNPVVWAEGFVDVELVPCRTGDCSEAPKASAVHADSWGRIKASFR